MKTVEIQKVIIYHLKLHKKEEYAYDPNRTVREYIDEYLKVWLSVLLLH